MLIGIILVAIGIVSFAYQGITYKTREKVVDIGPIHMTAEKTKTLPAAADCRSYCTRGRHCVAGYGEQKGVTRSKMLQLRDG
jgi:hypothetical protein